MLRNHKKIWQGVFILVIGVVCFAVLSKTSAMAEGSLGARNEILVWEPDPTPISASPIINFFDGLGFTVDSTGTLPPDVTGYQAVFVCLGISPNKHVLSNAEGTILATYLDNGGKLYMEGGDTWYYDPQTPVQPYFNINPISDGQLTIINVSGAPDTWFEGMTWGYTGENFWIDRIEPIPPAEQDFYNPNGNTILGVSYITDTYSTFGTSFEIGGLTCAPNLLVDALMGVGIRLGIIIPEYGQITGTALLEDGPPHDSTLIQAAYVSTYTDPTGYYMLDSVMTGVWDVKASKPGYTMQTYPDVEVIANDTTYGIDFYLPIWYAPPSFLVATNCLPNHVPLEWQTPPGPGWQWIYYDDGEFENGIASFASGYAISSRMSPPLHPCTISSIEFHVYPYEYVDYFYVYIYILDDAGGVPGTNILAGPLQVTFTGDTDIWMGVGIGDITIESGDFHIVCEWFYPHGPYISMDGTPPTEGRAWWGQVGGSWTNLEDMGYYYDMSFRAWVNCGNTRILLTSDGGTKPSTSAIPVKTELAKKEALTETEAMLSIVPESGARTVYAGGVPENMTGARQTLIGYNLYRDGALIESFIPGTSYDDTWWLVNWVAYEYWVTALYDVGEIAESDTSKHTFGYPLGVIIPPYCEDFEAHYGGYIREPDSPQNDWEWGRPRICQSPTPGPDGAHSGENCWATNLDDNYGANANWKLETLPIVLTEMDDAILTFWHWYIFLDHSDGGNVKISADDGATWEIIYPEGGYPEDAVDPVYNAGIPGEPAYSGVKNYWNSATFFLTDYVGDTVILRWHIGTTSWGTMPGWYVDDVCITPIIYGYIAGTVIEADNGPIEGAIVTAYNTRTFRDTTDENGDYCMIAESGIYDVIAQAAGYNTHTVSGVEVFGHDTTYVDFTLTYPEIEVIPTSIYDTLVYGTTADTTLYIINSGNGPLEFNIYVTGRLNLQRSTLSAKDRVQSDPGPVSFCRTPADWSPVPSASLDTGEIIESHPSVGEPTGFEWDGTYFWQGSFDGYVVKLDSDFNFIAQYTACGDPGMPPTGLAWHNGYLYQGCYTENNVYKIDVSDGYNSVEVIHVPGIYGLMGVEWVGDYIWVTDDETDIIYECDSLGNMINSWSSPEPVAFGMSYNPYLDIIYLNGWYEGNVYTIDPHTGDINLAFPTPGTPGYYSCCGSSFDSRYPVYLWIVHQGDNMIYLTDTGNEYESWISVTPASGTVLAGGTFEVTVTLDATEITAYDTTYLGALVIFNNSATSQLDIPVSMYVLPPPYCGAIEGIVTDAATGNSIAGAIVTAHNTFTYSDTTDANGHYLMSEILPEIYDMTVTAFGYNEFDTTGIVVLPEETTEVNFTLAHPEIVVEPASFDIELPVDTTHDTTMTINNSGNGPLTFDIEIEYSGGNQLFFLNTGVQKATNHEETTKGEFYQVSKDGTMLARIPQADFDYSLPRDSILSEGFEESWPPEEWSVLQTNTDNTNPIPGWWSQTDFSAHSGIYAAGLWWSLEHQDEWLITPEIFISDSTMMSFWTYGYQGSTHGDHYYVKVSTDDGATWDVVFDLSALSGDWNGWAFPYEINLSQYGGQNVILAWHAEDPPSNDGLWYVWIIDDITVETFAPQWLTMEPDSGIVEPGSSLDIALHFNTVVLAPDSIYHANLLIYNNSTTPVYTVPVTLHTGAVGVEDDAPKIPRVFALSQNYPNPLSPQTTISYTLPKSCKVSISIYNIKGQLVEKLVDEEQQPGNYSVVWNVPEKSGISSGIYFYRITAGDFTDTKKCIILK